jgi:hypothetical protein
MCMCFILYRGVQFYWWRKPEYPEKATDLPQVTDKLHQINLYLNFSEFMVFNITFNNISAISWHSVLFVEETGVPGENHRSAVSTDTIHLNQFTL